METTKEEDEFKKKFLAGEHIDDDLELTEEIIGKLGVGRTSKKNAFENLVRNRKETWRNLLDLKSEEKAIDAAGGDEDSGTAIWNAVQDYKKRAARLEEPKHNLPTLEQAFDKFSQTIRWPQSLDAFAPKLVQLDDSNPLAKSVREAKVYGSFKDPSVPDFLLTEMFEPIGYDSFCGIKVDPSENSYLDRITTLEENSLSTAKALVVVGTSGAGKTLYTLQRSMSEYAALFVCDTKGNGGSRDLMVVTQNARSSHAQGQPAFKIRPGIESDVNKLLFFRSRLLSLCCTRYEGFSHIHWAMAQLYSVHIFGEDVFVRFLSIETLPALLGSAEMGKMSLIIVDEAQVADTLLPDTFPSQQKPDIKRSLLAPLVQTLSLYRGQLVVCGTGLSAASVYETTISPLKEEVATRMIGVGTFFNEKGIQDALSKWGVTDIDLLTCSRFIGRPRHCALLARDYIMSGGAKRGVEAERRFIELYQDMIKKTRGLTVKRPSHTNQTNDEQDLYYHLRVCAFEYILGKPGTVTNNAETALQYGVCALKKCGDNDERGSSSSSSERPATYRAVLAEPLLIAALVDDAVKKFEERVLHGSHPEIGFFFEDYLALRASDFGGCVRNGATVLIERFKNYRDGLGQPSKRTGDISKKSKDDLVAFIGMFQDTNDALRKLGQRQLLVEPFMKNWEFVGSMSSRFAVRCERAGQETTHLESYLNQKRSVVIFCSEAMGPDLIILLWRDGKPLVVLVQAKSGKSYSTPQAILVLEQLYEQNRVAGNATTNDLARSFNDLLKRHDCCRALVVVKPLEGAKGDPVQCTDGNMLIVLHKGSLEKLMPSLKSGVENLARFKGSM